MEHFGLGARDLAVSVKQCIAKKKALARCRGAIYLVIALRTPISEETIIGVGWDFHP